MLATFIVALLLGLVLAQTRARFSAAVTVQGGLTFTGKLTGTFNYDFTTGTTALSGLNYPAWSLSYSFPSGYREMVRGENPTGQGVSYLKYLECPNKCEVSFGGIMYDFTQAGTTTTAGAWGSCTSSSKVTIQNPASPVGTNLRAYYFNGNIICGFETFNNDNWYFRSHTGLTTNQFTAGTNCPAPTCAAQIDIVQNLDDSGSISDSQWNTFMTQWVVPLFQKFKPKILSINQEGAVMTWVTFAGLSSYDDGATAAVGRATSKVGSTVTIGSTYNLAPFSSLADYNTFISSIQNFLANGQRTRGWTGTGGGMQVSIDQHIAFRQSAIGATRQSGKLLITVTDGYSNKWCSRTRTNVLKCKCTSGISCWNDGMNFGTNGVSQKSGVNVFTSFLSAPWTRTGANAVGYCLNRLSTQTQCGYLEWEADYARSIQLLTIGILVGGSINTEIQALSDSSTYAAASSSWDLLRNLLDQFVKQTCTTSSSVSNCPNCLGFCACDSTCICPNCDDGLACTVDTCDVVRTRGGCQNLARDCRPAGTVNNCLNYACAEPAGCSQSSVNCDDSNPCTTDQCSPSLTGGCYYTANTALCPPPDFCTNAVCVRQSATTHTCSYSPISLCNLCANVTCPSPNVCTITGCNLTNGNCTATPRDCKAQNGGNACTIDECLLTGVTTPGCQPPRSRDCDDSDPCTDNLCNSSIPYNPNSPNAACSNPQKNITSYCNDFDLCTEDLCSVSYPGPNTQGTPAGCYHQPINCSITFPAPRCFDSLCFNVFVGCQHFKTQCVPGSGVNVNCFASICSATNETVYIYDNGTIVGNYTIVGDGVCKSSKIVSPICNPAFVPGVVGGLGAAAIAGIIIAIIAIILAILAILFCGSAVGVAAYAKTRGVMTKVSSNPLFEDKPATENPFYQDNN